MKVIITNHVAPALSFFISLSFLPLLTASDASEHMNSLVSQVRENTATRLCHDTLLQGTSLSIIAINMTNENGTAVCDYIKKAAKEFDDKKVLKKCRGDIRKAMHNLDDARKLIQPKKTTIPLEVKKLVNLSISNGHGCLNMLKPPKPPTVFKSYVEIFTNLIDIIYNIIMLIPSAKPGYKPLWLNLSCISSFVILRVNILIILLYFLFLKQLIVEYTLFFLQQY